MELQALPETTFVFTGNHIAPGLNFNKLTFETSCDVEKSAG